MSNSITLCQVAVLIINIWLTNTPKVPLRLWRRNGSVQLRPVGAEYQTLSHVCVQPRGALHMCSWLLCGRSFLVPVA